MPHIRARLGTILLCTGLVVGAANVGAFAATGGPLLLGKSNVANKATKLKNTGNGPALKLKSKAGNAPFAVSNKTKIKKLNADLVDGLDGTALQTKAYRYELSGTSAGAIMRFALPGLPPGRYVANFSISATVPGGTVFFGCILDSGAPFANGQVAALGATGGGDTWFVNGGGLLDTTAAAYTVTCQSSGAAYTIPVVLPSHIVLTRVDDLTNAGSTGTPRTSSRPGFGG
ncbi:hypothetical protein [Nocardioides dilutus]